jgi:PTS system nitrogen regulatory IIA component
LIVRRAGLLAGGGDDADHVREALVARERLGSTALGNGVAIPHGRSSQIGAPRAVFARLAAAVDFGAGDGRPVDLVASLIVPAHFTEQHLQLLAELAELFSDANLVAALRAAPDDASLHRLLRERPRNAA